MLKPSAQQNAQENAPPNARFSHGGPDALGVPCHDFSTNSNACGPCPSALAAVQQADATRYPDPQYHALRESLAAFHRVSPARVLLGASASELIQRFSAWALQAAVPGGGQVWLPDHHFGDYARAAMALGLQRAADPAQAHLLWCCEPSSPLGQPQPGLAALAQGLASQQVAVLDCAYAPLRLSGSPGLSAELLNQVWQLWSPNKALGLTGVRAAYVVAPSGQNREMQASVDAVMANLHARSPSWPVGAHGAAMLHAWCESASQDWLRESLGTLRLWKARQLALCESLGWDCLPSEANYFCARIGAPELPSVLTRLRTQGIKLRDAASFGLPRLVRLGVLSPASQEVLSVGWHQRGKYSG